MILAGEGRCMGGKRCVRRAISLSNAYDLKLKKLSTSCDFPPATLASMIIQYALDSPEFIMSVQKQFNKNKHYWVTPVNSQGEITYLP